MKITLLHSAIVLSTILLTSLACDSPRQLSKKGASTIISQPIVIEGDDWRFEGTENILMVPENRNEESSRNIGLHFFTFPAKEKSTLPPVVFLGAGPGEPYSAEVFFKGRRAEAWRWELNFVNQKRDVILINQRGNSDAPGLQIHNFKYKYNNGGALDRPFDLAKMNDLRRKAYIQQVDEYQDSGIDLRGYDILHFVDDIEAVRQYVGSEKIALVGNSFASQWALGYVQRYPDHVDRALLSGVEPLDHNYDNPEGIWKVFGEIEKYAMQDESRALHFPKGGLLEAFKTIIQRLEEQPQTVVINDEGEDITVVVGADDFRMNNTYPFANSYASEIESWPKYITELYNGDYRTLAAASIGRMYNSSSLMINPLFNNSLGISTEREERLDSSPAKKWLGDLNDHYTSTRDICPAPKVSEDFRQHKKHKIPMVLIQGDMDFSTPYGNTEFLMDYLDNGHLVTVKRGSHNAKRALIFADSTLAVNIYNFMNLELDKEDTFDEFRKTLPKEYDLPTFDFWDIGGQPLYDKING